MTPRTPWLALAAAALCGRAAAARADEPARDPRRRVAVLEYRSGSEAMPEIAVRVATILRAKTSLAVIDGEDARKSYGAHIDRDLVGCGGQPDCVAKIGGKLEADEVLLVGVSEFGDVILTLQRVDVRDQKVLARVAEALGPDAAPDDAALTTYLQRVLPRADFLRFGVIRIDANVAGAIVTIDGTTRGRTPVPPIRVPAPWTYDIRVDKTGYTGFRASVAVPPEAEVRVHTVLSHVSRNPWYSHWWVAALAGTVAAGAVTLVLVTRDDPTEVPVELRPFE